MYSEKKVVKINGFASFLDITLLPDWCIADGNKEEQEVIDIDTQPILQTLSIVLFSNGPQRELFDVTKTKFEFVDSRLRLSVYYGHFLQASNHLRPINTEL